MILLFNYSAFTFRKNDLFFTELYLIMLSAGAGRPTSLGLSGCLS